MSKPYIWCATIVAAAIDLGDMFAATTAMVPATTDMGLVQRSISAAAIISTMALGVTALAVITDGLVGPSGPIGMALEIMR